MSYTEDEAHEGLVFSSGLWHRDNSTTMTDDETPSELHDPEELQNLQSIRRILRLGLISLMGYEFVQRTPLAHRFRDLIEVISQQRIALCHSLINSSNGGLQGTEEISPEEFVYRDAWMDAVNAAEQGDERSLAEKLEEVESLLERLSIRAADQVNDPSDPALEDAATSARGCREVWSSYALATREKRN